MKDRSGKKTSRKKAVALRYDTEKEASPKIVGKGSGHLAEKLLELAKKHNIPIHEDSDLVNILSKLELNDEIPPSTYIAVSEILAFIYRTNKSYPG
ncbi:MAG: EscU/YscU/HrcU family type III secretion system export apparatus switch protein [Deltaproteobacteria bacterium]|nr:EscU/YscU/HrcU family type III secretion system export apparatus switch protein [Deltaproteobacteria bacterium]